MSPMFYALMLPASQSLPGATPPSRSRVKRMRRMHATRLLIVALLFAGAVWQLGSGALIFVKAQLAQVMIERSWRQNQRSGQPLSRPWAWADTSPVAKLRFAAQNKDLMVLSGDSGRVMAFGPGHSTSTPLPGNGGNSVISGHRDTHFALLQWVQVNDEIELETISGEQITYKVNHMKVVDESEVGVMHDNGVDELTLVTCWPFNALQANGPERLVISALRVS